MLVALSIAPENAPSVEDDIYSFGCMALEMATGQQVHDPQMLRNRRCFDRALPGPQVCCRGTLDAWKSLGNRQHIPADRIGSFQQECMLASHRAASRPACRWSRL